MKHTNKVHGHKRVLMVVEKRHLISRAARVNSELLCLGTKAFKSDLDLKACR